MKTDQFIPRLAVRLREMGVPIRIEQDGTLSVLATGTRRNKDDLCAVGNAGEVYCRSKDLSLSDKREQLETVLKVVEELRSDIEQAESPERGSMGGMCL